jgi:hypothetical protein
LGLYAVWDYTTLGLSLWVAKRKTSAVIGLAQDGQTERTLMGCAGSNLSVPTGRLLWQGLVFFLFFGQFLLSAAVFQVLFQPEFLGHGSRTPQRGHLNLRTQRLGWRLPLKK